MVAGSAAAATAADGDTMRIRTPVKALNTTMVKGGDISPPAALMYAVAPVKDLRPNPLAQTPVDPTNNTVETQVADFRPVGTRLVTTPLTQGDAVRELPVVGQATQVLPG